MIIWIWGYLASIIIAVQSSKLSCVDCWLYKLSFSMSWLSPCCTFQLFYFYTQKSECPSRKKNVFLPRSPHREKFFCWLALMSRVYHLWLIERTTINHRDDIVNQTDEPGPCRMSRVFAATRQVIAMTILLITSMANQRDDHGSSGWNANCRLYDKWFVELKSHGLSVRKALLS